jgi:hypothetical protein
VAAFLRDGVPVREELRRRTLHDVQRAGPEQHECQTYAPRSGLRG